MQDAQAREPKRGEQNVVIDGGMTGTTGALVPPVPRRPPVAGAPAPDDVPPAPAFFCNEGVPPGEAPAPPLPAGTESSSSPAVRPPHPIASATHHMPVKYLRIIFASSMITPSRRSAVDTRRPSCKR